MIYQIYSQSLQTNEDTHKSLETLSRKASAYLMRDAGDASGIT